VVLGFSGLNLPSFERIHHDQQNEEQAQPASGKSHAMLSTHAPLVQPCVVACIAKHVLHQFTTGLT